jgi:acetyl esterase/lipase
VSPDSSYSFVRAFRMRPLCSSAGSGPDCERLSGTGRIRPMGVTRASPPIRSKPARRGPRNEAQAYAEQLTAAGVATRHICADSMVHGFLRLHGPVSDAQRATEEIARALN